MKVRANKQLFSNGEWKYFLEYRIFFVWVVVFSTFDKKLFDRRYLEHLRNKRVEVVK